jgi:hypothetical protein
MGRPFYTTLLTDCAQYLTRSPRQARPRKPRHRRQRPTPPTAIYSPLRTRPYQELRLWLLRRRRTIKKYYCLHRLATLVVPHAMQGVTDDKLITYLKVPLY